MDYEKLHKDTIAKLQEMVNSGKITVEIARGICADFIPESEDERIRKALIDGFKRYNDGALFNRCLVRDIVSWLEKEGEQKPTDKVVPKFEIEEGKWYICIRDLLDNYANRAFREGDIYLSTQNGSLIPSNSNVPFEIVCPDTYFKPFNGWNIQDAKDGDVLATENFIFIFKNIDNGNGVHYYCHYKISKHEDDNQFGIASPQSLMGRVGNSISHYSPATKEQRELLFQKMKEAGYEWDADKKELKKIELNTAWSEEDERNLQGIIDEIKANKTDAPDYDLATYDRFLSWLKSLKDRVSNFDDGYKVGFSAAKYNQ